MIISPKLCYHLLFLDSFFVLVGQTVFMDFQEQGYFSAVGCIGFKESFGKLGSN